MASTKKKQTDPMERPHYVADTIHLRYSSPDSAEVRAFIALCDPATILALLDALDAADKFSGKAREFVAENPCLCDAAYTDRGRHEPNAKCNQIRWLKDDLDDYDRAMGRMKS